MKNLKHRLSILCVCTFAVLLLSPPLLAQGVLTVKCVDQGGNPVSGARVVAQMLGPVKPKEKKSDNKGMADFGKVEDGAYRIVGRKEAMDPAFFEFVVIKGAPQSVAISFKAGDPAKKLYFEDQALSAKAIESLNQGIQALKDNKFPEAEKLFSEGIEINPSLPMAHFYLAIAQLQLKKWDAAGESLKKTAGFAEMMLSIGSRDPNAAAQLTEIRDKSVEQLAKLPANKLRDEGEKLFSQKKYEEAAVKFREGLKVDPKDVELLSNLSVTAANMRLYDEAFQMIDRAIELAPTDKPLKDTRERIANMKAIDLQSQANVILGEGDNLYKSQDFAGALKKYEAAMPMVPAGRQSVIYAAIARCQVGLNKGDDAIGAYRKAMEVAANPNDADNYRNALFQYLLKNKRLDDAANLYTDPKGAGDKALFAVGKKQGDAGNSEAAAFFFDRAIKSNPENAEAYYELGMILYFDKTNDVRATELLSKYVEIGKNADHVDNSKNSLVLLKRRLAKK